MIENNEDISMVCTSLITDMNGFFQYSEFNGDIASWDVSHVTNMMAMFNQSQFNGKHIKLGCRQCNRYEFYV